MLFTGLVCVSVRVHLVDDVDGVLQQETCSLPLVGSAGVLGQLLDLLLGCFTEQHLTTTQRHYDTEKNGFCARLVMKGALCDLFTVSVYLIYSQFRDHWPQSTRQYQTPGLHDEGA